MKLTSTLALLLSLFGAAVASAQDAPKDSAPKKPVPSVDETAQAASDASNAFAFDLYRQLVKSADGNVLFSPYSISSALGMTYAGAQGETRAQLERVLRFDNTIHIGHAALDRLLVTSEPAPKSAGVVGSLDGASEGASSGGKPSGAKPSGSLPASASKPAAPSHVLRIANRIWPQSGFAFKPQFQRTLHLNYGGFQELDYMSDPDAAKDTINAWVAEQTKNAAGKPMVPELLESLESTTRMVLTNAVYFGGAWQDAFNPDDTRPGMFRGFDDSSITPMMSRTEAKLRLSALASGEQLLDLPFSRGAASLIVILPKENTAASFAALEAALSPDALDAAISKAVERELDLYLPKFEITGEFQLKDALEGMGVTDLFDEGAADLRRMAATVDANGMERNLLHVTKVVHKAVASFDEKGAEAAAATAVVIGLESFTPSFSADRPFVFAIRDNATGTILFLGRVLELGTN